MIDLLHFPEFLDAATRAEFVAELERANGAASTVLARNPGGVVHASARKSTRLEPSAETRAMVKQRLMERRAEIEAHFGVAIAECEDPQFLRYETGDFFVPHQDGNTPMLHDDSRFRRISAVIFLSRQADEPSPDTYGGGSLVFHGPYSGPPLRETARAEPGTLVTFRSETTHEVTPITHGVRLSIATWFRAPA